MPVATKAILFGAIGTLSDTSELQRESYNAAFRAAGLDWEWTRSAYAELLQAPGGEDRIARYAAARGERVDAARLHKVKVAQFRARAELGLELRPGVREVIAAAHEANVALGLVTTTGAETVDLIFDGLKGQLDRSDFAYIGHRDMVSRAKPAPECYHLALSTLGVGAADAVAIEDTPESAEAALAADINCIGFPGTAARERSFPIVINHVVDQLAPIFVGLRSLAA